MIADGDAVVLVPARLGDAVRGPLRVAVRPPPVRHRDRRRNARRRAHVARLPGRLRIVLGDVPYNVTINTAPAADDRPYHWWLDILPRLTVTAGFEHATGLSVCTIAPEAAAAAIREDVMTVRVAVTIEASPQRVWAVIEPIETHVDWMTDAVAITFTSAQTARCRYRRSTASPRSVRSEPPIA